MSLITDKSILLIALKPGKGVNYLSHFVWPSIAVCSFDCEVPYSKANIAGAFKPMSVIIETTIETECNKSSSVSTTFLGVRAILFYDALLKESFYFMGIHYFSEA